MFYIRNLEKPAPPASCRVKRPKFVTKNPILFKGLVAVEEALSCDGESNEGCNLVDTKIGQECVCGMSCRR